MRFVYPEDGMLGVVNMACILKDSPNKIAAERFLNDYLTIETQELQAQIWGEGPVVKGAKTPEDSLYVMVDPSKLDDIIIYDANEAALRRKRETLRILDSDGTNLPSKTVLGAGERTWNFVPRKPWLSVRYSVVIGGNLEDLAVKRPVRFFDRPAAQMQNDWASLLRFVPRGPQR